MIRGALVAEKSVVSIRVDGDRKHFPQGLEPSLDLLDLRQRDVGVLGAEKAQDRPLYVTGSVQRRRRGIVSDAAAIKRHRGLDHGRKFTGGHESDGPTYTETGDPDPLPVHKSLAPEVG